MRKSTIALAFAVVSGLALDASAGPVTCPEPSKIALGVRVFTLTTEPTATCLDYGPGNDKDWSDLDKWSLLDKSDDIGTGFDGWLKMSPAAGTKAGHFEVAPVAWTKYSSLVLLLKSGGSTANPDWAAFQLAKGTLQGDWTITGLELTGKRNQDQTLTDIDGSLSHASLYGQGTPQVPEPASMLLLGTGLLGAGWLGRKRKQ